VDGFGAATFWRSLQRHCAKQIKQNSTTFKFQRIELFLPTDISHGSREINSGMLDITLERHGAACQLRLIWCGGAQYANLSPYFST
jgi:hypothetical protein